MSTGVIPSYMILHYRFLLLPYPSDNSWRTWRYIICSLLNSLLIQSLHAFTRMPYDLYCPSVRGDLVEERCSTCGIYFTSITKAAEHQQSSTDCYKTNYWVSESEQSWRSRRFYWIYMDMLVPIVTFETVCESP